MKRIIVELIGLLMVVSGFAGCAKNQGADMAQTEKAEIPTEVPFTEAEKPQQKRHEIPIEFPFAEPEEYKLTLASFEENPEEYELILHAAESGKVLLQLPCGKLVEPVEFSFDGLAYGSWNDLEIFSGERDAGLLFIWKDGLFSTDPIEISRYEEARGTAMLTFVEEEKLCEKQVYLLNEAKNRTEKARSFKLQKDTGMLTIRNELEDKNFLIYTWIGEEAEGQEGENEISSFEDVQNYLFGNSGHTQEYESSQALLKDFGFESSEPVYQYFDQYGNLQLELYADDSVEKICGIVYAYHFNSELEKEVSMHGFAQCSVPEAKWDGHDPFVMKSMYGTDGSDYVEEYEESIEYADCRIISWRKEGWRKDRRNTSSKKSWKLTLSTGRMAHCFAGTIFIIAGFSGQP